MTNVNSIQEKAVPKTNTTSKTAEPQNNTTYNKNEIFEALKIQQQNYEHQKANNWGMLLKYLIARKGNATL